MKKATINISNVKYFADEHELRVLGKLAAGDMEFDFVSTHKVNDNEIRIDYEDVRMSYSSNEHSKFSYDKNGKNAANINKSVERRAKEFISCAFDDVHTEEAKAIFCHTRFAMEYIAYANNELCKALPIEFYDDKANRDGTFTGAAKLNKSITIEYLVSNGKIEKLFLPWSEDKADLRDINADADTVSSICDAIMQHVERVKATK